MWKHIFIATLLAGILDISAASIQVFLAARLTPDVVLRYIASGAFGKAADTSWPYLLFGLLVHFFIVFMCALVYFRLYPRISLVRKNIFLSAFLIAGIAWIVTTRIIIPLSKINPPPFHWEKALLAVAILYICVGIPIAVIAAGFFESAKEKVTG